MKPQKIYAEVLEDTAREQFESAMALDYVVKGALMPDAHTGYGLPIGAVVATKGVIVPSWVGYDIGCGMLAVNTGVKQHHISHAKDAIYEAIYKSVPVGFEKNSSPYVPYDLLRGELTDTGGEIFDKRGGYTNLGTLGGGNHFIEIGELNDNIWIVVHSGSRGVGHGIATEYMIRAGGGKCREGHYPLNADSAAGQLYINDMRWCESFAIENREQIATKVMNAIDEACGKVCEAVEVINRNHNHAELKDGLWIHRKGATHAEKNMMGVIPGNMRDGSFIVRGKGNPESLCSSSHGAGRVMCRKQAKKELSMDQFAEEMTGVKGKVCLDTLDESPMAYKNIFEVMELQKDLVEVVGHIKPIINIKG